jgi:hypothetical protein
MMGIMFHQGLGTDKNKEFSLGALNDAAGKGDGEAVAYLRDMQAVQNAFEAAEPLADQERSQEIWGILAPFAQANPNIPNSLFWILWAEANSDLEHYEDAIAGYMNGAREAYIDSPWFHLEIATAYLRNGQIKESVEEFASIALTDWRDYPFSDGEKEALDERVAAFSFELEQAKNAQGRQNGREMGTQPEAPTQSGRCYVATAVYGSYDCEEVWVLRRFRDYALKRTWRGRLFIRAYYWLGPMLARRLGRAKAVRAFARTRLDKFVCSLRDAGYSNKPYCGE